MASKELLKALDFRRFNLRLDGISKIVVRYGASKEKGHVAARKFFKNYLPVLLYHNPSIVASVKKYGTGVEGGGGGGGKKDKSSEGVLSTEKTNKGSTTSSSSSSQTETPLSPLSIAAMCELSEEPHVAFFGENGSGRVFKTREIAEQFKKQEESGEGEGRGSREGAIVGSSQASSGNGGGGGGGGGGGIKGLALHVDRFIFREVTGGNDFIAEEKPRKPQGKKGGRRKAKSDKEGGGAQAATEESSTEKLA